MLRALLKRPGFSSVVVLTLALGLDTMIGIFSVANAVLCARFRIRRRSASSC